MIYRHPYDAGYLAFFHGARLLDNPNETLASWRAWREGWTVAAGRYW